MNLSGPVDDIGSALRGLSGSVFAVIDGAQYSNLPGRLETVGLEFAALYVDEIDNPDLRFGPHLVVCPTGYAVEQVRDVAAGSPSVVWWSWPDAGADTAHQLIGHLRRLALVDVPTGLQSVAMGPPRHGTILSSEPFEPVLFRHADPDVIAAILPVLDAKQTKRLLGGAEAVLAESAQDQAVTILKNPDPTAEMPFGRIRLEQAQYQALSATYRAALRRRAVLEFEPDLPGVNFADRKTRLEDALDRAEAYGLISKSQLWDFVALDLRYGARFELQPDAAKVLFELKAQDRPAGERLWRAELSMQMVRGEDRQSVSGSRLR